MADAMRDIALELARKDFEEWAKGPKLPLERDRALYAEYMTQLAWDAWKAALLRPHVCPNESFWVVERFENGRSAGYWDGASSRSFQFDIGKAIQFRRKEDAFWATCGWHWKDVELTEHLMMPALPSVPLSLESKGETK